MPFGGIAGFCLIDYKVCIFRAEGWHRRSESLSRCLVGAFLCALTAQTLERSMLVQLQNSVAGVGHPKPLKLDSILPALHLVCSSSSFLKISLVVLGIKSRALCMLGECSTTELHHSLCHASTHFSSLHPAP